MTLFFFFPVYPGQFLFFQFLWVSLKEEEFDPKCCEVIMSVSMISFYDSTVFIMIIHFNNNKKNVTFYF